MALKLKRKTRSIMLTSGPMAEITALVGKHQRMLTEKGKNLHDKMNDVLADVLLSVEGIDLEGMQAYQKARFVESMLSSDRRKLLEEARQLSQSSNPTFNYVHEYKKPNGQKASAEFVISLIDEENREAVIENILEKFEDKDKFRPIVERLNRVGCFPTRPCLILHSDYNSVLDNKKIVFEVGGELEGYKIRFTMLDGKLEKAVKPENMSSHTIYEIRQLQYSENGETWLKFQRNELDQLSMDTLDAIRHTIEKYEGDLDTVEVIPNPDETSEEAEIKVDLMGQVGFFFPSGRI